MIGKTILEEVKQVLKDSGIIVQQVTIEEGLGDFTLKIKGSVPINRELNEN
jgi:hypothetical protein